jgi:hypothetical protein
MNLNDVNVPSNRNQQKTFKKYLFVGVLKVNDEKWQDPDPLVRGTDPDPYQNVMDPQLCRLNTKREKNHNIGALH